MGLFSFLFKKKAKTEVAVEVDGVDREAPAPVEPPAAPLGSPDHAPQPIPAEPLERNPIAAAMESQRQETGIPLPVEPFKPELNPVSASLPAPAAVPVTRSPEEMCEIDPETMDRDMIRAHLAVLYRRHNAAAASLDADLRAEAELMLDAIVACREKHIEAP